MNLQEHYDQLYKKSSEQISADNYSIDTNIQNELDSRFGLTLIIRPSEQIKSEIQLLLYELRKIEPEQYFYPDSDIHITVLSIISCFEGFNLSEISTNDYIEIICKSLVEVDNIKIHFKGVTASPSAIMIQGFPTDETLNNFRDKLRENFKKSGLKQSIDSRYTISAAHSTVMRFQKELQDPKQLMQTIAQFRDYDFGEFEVKNLELVYNDWYQRKSNTKVLGDFGLR